MVIGAKKPSPKKLLHTLSYSHGLVIPKGRTTTPFYALDPAIFKSYTMDVRPIVLLLHSKTCGACKQYLDEKKGTFVQAASKLWDKAHFATLAVSSDDEASLKILHTTAPKGDYHVPQLALFDGRTGEWLHTFPTGARSILEIEDAIHKVMVAHEHPKFVREL